MNLSYYEQRMEKNIDKKEGICYNQSYIYIRKERIPGYDSVYRR